MTTDKRAAPCRPFLRRGRRGHHASGRVMMCYCGVMDSIRAYLYDTLSMLLEKSVQPDPKADLAELYDMTAFDFDVFFTMIDEDYPFEMNKYYWYFHCREHAKRPISRFLSQSPDEQVQRIPITIDLVEQAIKQKRWPVLYPPVPRHFELRYQIVTLLDIIPSLLAYVAFIAALVVLAPILD